MSRLCLTLALGLLQGVPTPDPQAQTTAAKIDGLLREYDGADVPGACVMVVRDGYVLFQKAYGMANLEEKRLAKTSTNYRLAAYGTHRISLGRHCITSIRPCDQG